MPFFSVVARPFRRVMPLVLFGSVWLLFFASEPISAANPKGKEHPPNFETLWELVAWYSKDYDMDGMHQRLKRMFGPNERNLNPHMRRVKLLPGYEKRAGFDATTKHKLMHDIEQFQWLASNEKLGITERGRALFSKKLPQLYQSVLDRMDDAHFDEEKELYEFQEADREIKEWYNRAIFMPEFGPLKNVEESSPLLNPAVDFSRIERQYFGEEDGYEHPGIVVIDNLLSPRVLERVRDYLVMSTFWFEAKPPGIGKYLGAYLGDGMHDKFLMEIAFELHKAMPRVMQDHAMKELWSYKYESSESADEERTGIHTHADDAIVNCNIWLTPDSANEDPNSGGLVVYTTKPPQEWEDFNSFNSNWEYVEENLLKPTNFANVTVPYRQNRAVIFDSFLFHKTDKHKFRKGYENRRINLTILYGERQSKATVSNEL